MLFHIKDTVCYNKSRTLIFVLLFLSPKRNRTDEDSDESDYLNDVTKQIEENRAAFDALVPKAAPKLRPARKKQSKKNGELF